MIDYVFEEFDWDILDPATRRQINEGYHKFWCDCELKIVNGKTIRTNIPRQKPLSDLNYNYYGKADKRGRRDEESWVG